MLLKCVSGAAEILRIPKSGACVHRVCMHIFYWIFVQFMQFPILYLGLDHFTSQPFNFAGVQFKIMLETCLPKKCADEKSSSAIIDFSSNREVGIIIM